MPAEVPYEEVSTVEAWRGLLARGSLLSACSTRLAHLHDLTFADGSVLGVVNDLALADGVAQASPSDASAVGDAAREWQASIKRWLANPATTEEEVRALLEEVHGFCDGASVEDAFGTIFRALCELSAAVYGEAWIPPGLELNDLRNHPNAGSPYAVLAGTEPGAGPTVTLMIYRQGLGPATFAALPGLLAHECLCHVPARQDRVKNDSKFAEGFMDWAARYFFDGSVAHLLPDLGPAVRAHSRPYGELLASQHTTEGRARRFGWQVADHLVRLVITDLAFTVLQAEAAVARLARDLNVLDAPINLKDLLVTDIFAMTTLDPFFREVLNGTRPASELI